MNSEFPNRKLVHAALDAYWDAEPERERLFKRIVEDGIPVPEVQERFEAWQEQCKADLHVLRVAFHEATSDRNSYANCMLVGPADVARMSGYERKLSEPA